MLDPVFYPRYIILGHLLIYALILLLSVIFALAHKNLYSVSYGRLHPPHVQPSNLYTIG